MEPNRYVCLHGHFYQPPRENPWIEDIEIQDSAAPYHDWNQRIAADCYGPNAAARIKNGAGRIVDIVNNYRHLSFNFGPTLLVWLSRHAEPIYRAVLEADASSVLRRGHGNAIAQAYNHAILPLCSPRDLRTQIRWGLSDFRARFGRESEGFWLPETAADRNTLRALTDEGVRFTILSPYQAKGVRPVGNPGPFQDASGGRFDPSRPYLVHLGGHRSIVVFFYDGPIARSLAFGDGLATADALVDRITSGFDDSREHEQLLTVAVDGETFGHHKRGADEVLAGTLRRLDGRNDVTLVNFAQALDLMPVLWEAEIVEGSSWSCAHGLERWRSDCGCEANGRSGWRQGWRGPLRAALDELRDRLAAIYERQGAHLFKDPWATRDAFIEISLDPERLGAGTFLERQAGRPLDGGEQTAALRLLEMQRQAQLMYTSCGWFFSEVSGLETVQILKYAARAIQLARDVSGVDLEPRMRELLARAPSNLPELEHGGRVWERYVLPSVVSLEGVAAHHAIVNLFAKTSEDGRLFSYRYTVHSRRSETIGPATLAVGRIELSSLHTLQRIDLSFCVLHFGDADFRCGLRPWGDAAAHAELEQTLFARLGRISLAQVVREIDRAFAGRDYTLRDLFLDERRRMATLLLSATLARHESDYIRIFDTNRRLMEFLREINSPLPTPLRVAADVGLGHALGKVAEKLLHDELDVTAAGIEMEGLQRLAQSLGAQLDCEPFRRALHAFITEGVERLSGEARREAEELVEAIALADRLSLPLDLWRPQNQLWDRAKTGQYHLGKELLARLARRFYFDEAAFLERSQVALQPSGFLVGAARLSGGG